MAALYSVPYEVYFNETFQLDWLQVFIFSVEVCLFRQQTWSLHSNKVRVLPVGHLNDHVRHIEITSNLQIAHQYDFFQTLTSGPSKTFKISMRRDQCMLPVTLKKRHVDVSLKSYIPFCTELQITELNQWIIATWH